MSLATDPDIELLDLPNELLAHIVSDTMPLGFESFVLSCKRLYAIAQERKLIEQHNSLIHAYQHVDFAGQELDWSKEGTLPRLQCSLHLLLEIACQPVIARYIDTAFLLPVSPTEEAMQNTLDADILDIGTCDAALRRFLPIRKSLKPPADIKPTSRLQTVAHGASSRADVVWASSWRIALISLMTNVSKLAIPHQWLHPSTSHSTALLDALATEAARPAGGALSNITEVEIWGLTDDPTPFQQLNIFLALPRIRRLWCGQATGTENPERYWPVEWCCPASASQLECLEFFWCVISHFELKKMLARTPKLRRFRMHKAAVVSEMQTWNVGWVVQALQDYCGGTLTEITISIECHADVITGYMCDFIGFKVLERLELDTRCFCAPPRAAAADAPDASAVSLPPRLADMLPATIKTVRLLTGTHDSQTFLLNGLFSRWHIDDCESGTQRRVLPSLQMVDVLRGSVTVGGVPVDEGQDEEAWAAARRVIEAAGCSYSDVPHASPEWVEKSRAGLLDYWCVVREIEADA